MIKNTEEEHLASNNGKDKTDGTDASRRTIPQFAPTRRYRRYATSVVCAIVPLRQQQSNWWYCESLKDN